MIESTQRVELTNPIDHLPEPSTPALIPTNTMHGAYFSKMFHRTAPRGQALVQRGAARQPKTTAPTRNLSATTGGAPEPPAHLDPKLVVQEHATDPGEAYQEGLAL